MKVLFEDNRGKGYRGKSMSVNAVNAYDNGEMPLSKWTKSAIISELCQYTDIDCSKLTQKELQDYFLVQTSWHHTSALYNVTGFYSIDKDIALNLTDDDIRDIILKRSNAKEIRNIRKPSSNIEDVKYALNMLSVIYHSGITGLKTPLGVFKKFNTIEDMQNMYNKAIDFTIQSYADNVHRWEKLPADHWRQNFVNNYYNNPEEFALSVYGNKFAVNGKEYRMIKDKFFKNN